MNSDRSIDELRDILTQSLPHAARAQVPAPVSGVAKDPRSVAGRIDHTDLRPTATPQDAREACRIARSAGCAAVCLSPRHVSLAAEALAGSAVAVCTVVGFPHGTQEPGIKVSEAARAIEQGAQEIDMVISLGDLRARDFGAVYEEIAGVRRGAGAGILKVIIETTLLSEEEKVLAAILAQWAGADFVKTSTGFAGGGATPSDVRLLRRAVGGGLRIKASGGIRTAGQALALLDAGADRLGMSSTLSVLAELPVRAGAQR